MNSVFIFKFCFSKFWHKWILKWSVQNGQSQECIQPKRREKIFCKDSYIENNHKNKWAELLGRAYCQKSEVFKNWLICFQWQVRCSSWEAIVAQGYGQRSLKMNTPGQKASAPIPPFTLNHCYTPSQENQYSQWWILPILNTKIKTDFAFF